MRNLLLIAIAVTSQAVIAAGGIYSWTDESGNVIYGDTPPDNISAKSIDPPKLTVLEGFSSRYKTEPVFDKQSTSHSAPKNTQPDKKVIYTEMKVIAPKKDQSIRANDGDVSVALSLSPKLRAGDRIVISLDGKEYSRGTSRVANLTNLDRGEHTLMVSVVNKAARSLISSEEVIFNILRNSALINKPYSPYPEDANAIKPFAYGNN
jgi:hypothetical protein